MLLRACQARLHSPCPDLNMSSGRRRANGPAGHLFLRTPKTLSKRTRVIPQQAAQEVKTKAYYYKYLPGSIPRSQAGH